MIWRLNCPLYWEYSPFEEEAYASSKSVGKYVDKENDAVRTFYAQWGALHPTAFACH